MRPSAVRSPISHQELLGDPLRLVEVGRRRRRRRRTARRGRTRTTGRIRRSDPCRSPRTAPAVSSADERRFEARLRERGELAPGRRRGRRTPSRSRDAMRSSSRRLYRRRPLRRRARVGRPPAARSRRASSTNRSRGFGSASNVVVAERLHEVRLVAQRVAEHATRAEDPARALRGAGRVAEHGRRGWPPEPGPSASRRSWSSARSGSGDSEHHSSSTGRSCSMSRDVRLKPRVSSSSAARVAREVEEAERAEPFLGRLGGERTGPAGERSRAADRRTASRGSSARAPGAPGARRRAARPPERSAPVAVPEHPGQARPGGRVGRERVRLLLVPELEPVLDGAEEPVGRVERHRRRAGST